MAWRFEHTQTIPILTDGTYALTMGTADLPLLKAAAAQGGMGALRTALDEIASRHRKPSDGRTQLRSAFERDGRRQDQILDEIRAALP